MRLKSQHKSPRMNQLVTDSPLRAADARVKLGLVLLLTMGGMLPITRLAVFLPLFVALMAYGHLLPAAAHQVRRLAWTLLFLAILDWVFIGFEFAMLISLRLVVMVSASTLLVCTTTPEEFRQALMQLGIPYRLAFVLGLAFQAVPLLSDEWQHIKEAQQARGALRVAHSWRELPMQVRDTVALAVPAVVLTTQRAWALTEAVHARGFDSPRRVRQATALPAKLDWALLATTLVSVIALAAYR